MATVYKRGSTWWVRYQIDGQHVRRSAKTTRKSEAEALLRRLLAAHSKAPDDDRNNHTLSQAFDRFFVEARLKKGTLRTYQSNSRNWVQFAPAACLEEITSPFLADFVSSRKRAGVTDTTIRRDLGFLSSVLSMAIVWGWISTNPVTRNAKKPLRESRPRTRFLSRAEFERLYAASSDDLRPVIVLAVETGMRKEEMLGLLIRNIDLRKREVHLDETKTGAPRRVPLSDKAIETITTVLSAPRRPHSAYLFCKGDGSRILCNKKGFRAACARAKIDDFRFHDLRHTFASWWVQSGGDLYKLSRVLGHRTLQMSARYGHLRTDDLHDELARVTQKRSQDQKVRGEPAKRKAPA